MIINNKTSWSYTCVLGFKRCETIAQESRSPFSLWVLASSFPLSISPGFYFSINGAGSTGSSWSRHGLVFSQCWVGSWLGRFILKAFPLTCSLGDMVTLSLTENMVLCFSLRTESSDKGSSIWKVNPNTHLWQIKCLIPWADNFLGIRMWNRKRGSSMTHEVLVKHLWVEDAVPWWLSSFNCKL